jgi:hypothetical protein
LEDFAEVASADPAPSPVDLHLIERYGLRVSAVREQITAALILRICAC